MLRTIAIITCALTVAGSTWYIAVSLTTPSDLTAIYNCSAFFAYAFSIPLLGERVKTEKMVSVAVAIMGVLIVAYGDGAGSREPVEKAGKRDEVGGSTRIVGNVIIGVGSVLYGFYEVLYKKMACPPEGTSSGRSVIFANTVGSGIGAFTLVRWRASQSTADNARVFFQRADCSVVVTIAGDVDSASDTAHYGH